MDYAVWGILKGRAYRHHHATVESLVHSLDEAWDNMSADPIIKF